MGVWQRSPAGLRIALANPELDAGNRAALPDLRAEDVIGSPYCVRDYVVDERFGGPDALAAARAAARATGALALILDYVPNHVAPDHPWLTARPECLLRRQRRGARRSTRRRSSAPPAASFANGARPVLPAVARRRAAERLLARAARRRRRDADRGRRAVRRPALRHGDADDQRGLRAHLGRAGRPRPRGRLLADADRPRRRRPIPTCCSSPRRTGTWSGRCSSRASTSATTSASTTAWSTIRPTSVRGHLQADAAYQERLIRFIENHDEPRAAATFGPAQARAAAVVMSTLQGARLYHDGQLEGRRTRIPVFLGRGPDEPADADLRAFYERLLRAVADSGPARGRLAAVRVQRLARQRLPPAAGRLVLVDRRARATSWSSTSPTRPPRRGCTCPGRTWPGGPGSWPTG